MASTAVVEPAELVRSVIVDDERLTFELTDGRTVSAPLEWYPRLRNGTPEQRNRWRLLGGGQGVHWPDIDEDLSLEGVLAGKRAPAGSEHWRSSLPI